MFHGIFESKTDICEQFCIADFEGVVVFAAYEYEDYSGSAEVIYVHNGKFYMVSGSHCSCMGLEGQWEPVEMPLEGLERIVLQGSGLLSRFGDKLVEAIRILYRLNIEEATPNTIDVAFKMAIS